MFINLHKFGFLQGSTYPRNILVQPGPLSNPPSKRSLTTPSFRIIDFGRVEYWPHFISKEIGIAAWEQHEEWLKNNDEFIKNVGAYEAEKYYTIIVSGDDDGNGEGKEGKGKAKRKEMTMVKGLEKDKWTQLSKTHCQWHKMVMEEDSNVKNCLIGMW